jgi:hypothetical protein
MNAKILEQKNDIDKLKRELETGRVLVCGWY